MEVDPSGLADLCVRKLILPFPYIQHCYFNFEVGGIWADSSSFDSGGTGSDPIAWWPWFEKICYPISYPELPSGLYSAETVRRNQARFDVCLKKQMNACKKEEYSLFMFNCCDCVAKSLANCGEPVDWRFGPNWPFNPKNGGQ